MQTLTLSSDNIHSIVSQAKEVLSTPGAVLLVPTETVYGLVCKASDTQAVDRIYDLKDRDRSKKLALFVYDWRKLSHIGVKLEGLPTQLAQRYCPGAITIIAKDQSNETVGFRVPDHPFILELLKNIDFALASTSANLSGNPNALNVSDALKELNGEPSLVVDNGEIPANALASTVVDATGDTVKIIRQGALIIN